MYDKCTIIKWSTSILFYNVVEKLSENDLQYTTVPGICNYMPWEYIVKKAGCIFRIHVIHVPNNLYAISWQIMLVIINQ